MKRRNRGSGRREIVRFQILELVDLRLDDDARNGPLKFPGYWLCYRIWSKAGSYPMNTGRSQAEIENWAYEIELAVATQNIYWTEIDYG